MYKEGVKYGFCYCSDCLSPSIHLLIHSFFISCTYFYTMFFFHLTGWKQCLFLNLLLAESDKNNLILNVEDDIFTTGKCVIGRNRIDVYLKIFVLIIFR